MTPADSMSPTSALALVAAVFIIAGMVTAAVGADSLSESTKRTSRTVGIVLVSVGGLALIVGLLIGASW